MGAECFVFGSWKVSLCSWPSGRPLPSRGGSRLRSGGQRVGSHLWHMTGAAQALLLWGEGTCASHVWKQPVPFSPTCSANTERRPLSSSFQDKHRPAARSSSQMQLRWALLDTPPHPTPPCLAWPAWDEWSTLGLGALAGTPRWPPRLGCTARGAEDRPFGSTAFHGRGPQQRLGRGKPEGCSEGALGLGLVLRMCDQGI